MRKVRFICLAVFLAVAQIGAQARPMNAMTSPGGAVAAGERTATGYVTGISDGDTFYMQIDGKATRFRLAQVDCPEKNQPYGRRAEQSLRELIGKRQVTVTWRESDRYGRPVVQVQADGVDVNAEQVKRGLAWVYKRYASDPYLFTLEREARAARRGLWADLDPVAPWEWRKRQPKAER